MHSKRTWWPVLSGIALSALALLAIFFEIAGAQNLPPPGAYQPIPNFTGVGAGLQFARRSTIACREYSRSCRWLSPKLRQSAGRAGWTVDLLQGYRARDAMRRRRQRRMGAWR